MKARLVPGIYPQGVSMEDLTKRLNTEADQCANDGVNDIATLLWGAASVVDGLRTELANERARSIHTCHDHCTRSGCVNARLRAEVEALRVQRDGSAVVLRDLADEFVRVFPIYYYAEPWAHDRNQPLLNARLQLAALTNREG